MSASSASQPSLSVRIPARMLLLLLVCALPVLAAAPRQAATPPAAPATVPTSSSTRPAYGVNFISWAKGLDSVEESRYQAGLSTGAAWNRWPMYWNDIEQSAGNFSWAYQDATVIADIAHGLQINAILLGTPGFYTTAVNGNAAPADGLLALNEVQAATPQGLYESVFSDGSDIPGPEKTINPDNRWARFVATAVARYMPGGIIAGQENWPAGIGITHWEIWNEPDLPFFWDGSTADYARLLKVAYLAAKQIDPEAQILFGGLANNSNNPNFFNNVMAIYDADGMAAGYDYFHDIFATHNYLYAWDSWYHVWRAQNTLDIRDLDKPIWLNESGVPVWDDYPGPVCEPDSPYRATMSEQADFIFQSALYATYAGADTIFFFQLYDDCGNQPGNTNFSPVTECKGGDPGGDAFGLFRNVADPALSGCYWAHPLGGTARPGLTAYQTLVTYFADVQPLWRQRAGGSDPFNGPQEWIAFYQPATGSRIVGLWARNGAAETAVIPATNQSGAGQLVAPDGSVQPITAVDGYFTIELPGATNQNAIWDPTLYPIGGRPYLLIEQDDLPPTVSGFSGDLFATDEINLQWNGSDDGSGIAIYQIQVAQDDADWELWQAGITDTNAVFPAEEGHIYRFRLTGFDHAGNASEAEVWTAFTKELPETRFLPLFFKN